MEMSLNDAKLQAVVHVHVALQDIDGITANMKSAFSSYNSDTQPTMALLRQAQHTPINGRRSAKSIL